MSRGRRARRRRSAAADLVDAGGAEDSAVACAIQRSLASGANEFFEFGRFEGAIAHFHRALHAALDAERGEPARRRGARRARKRRSSSAPRRPDARAPGASGARGARARWLRHGVGAVDRRAGRGLDGSALPPLPFQGRAVRRGVPRRGGRGARCAEWGGAPGRELRRAARGGGRDVRPQGAAQPPARLGTRLRAGGSAGRCRAPRLPA